MRVDRRTASGREYARRNAMGRGDGHRLVVRMTMSSLLAAIPIASVHGHQDPTDPSATRVSQVGAAETRQEGSSTSSGQEGGTKPNDDSPRSLDDLLGIPSRESASGEAATDRSSDRRLEQTLDGANMQDLVVRAMDGMREAARRLGQERDAGLGTQRIQQDIVATLDRLLAEAQRQQQSSKGSSRSRSRQQQSSSDDPSEQNGQTRNSSSPSDSSPSGSSSEPGSDESEGQRPADDSAVSGAELDESRVEWGRLPERVRELILQGRRDRVSTLYERITREYYRRLAEEASR